MISDIYVFPKTIFDEEIYYFALLGNIYNIENAHSTSAPNSQIFHCTKKWSRTTNVNNINVPILKMFTQNN